MAQSNITINYLQPNAGIALPATSTSTAGAGNEFVVQPDGKPHRNLFVYVDNTQASATTVTVLAGAVQADALDAGQGNVSYSVPASSVALIGPFDSARVTQPNDTYLIQTSAAVGVAVLNIDGRYV